MNNEQKNETKRLPGFYIALCCCVLAIGVAGYFTERHEKNAEKNVSAPAVVEEDVVYSEDDITATPYVNTAVLPTQTPEAEDAEETAMVSGPAEYEDVLEESEDYTYDNPDVQDTAVIVNAEGFGIRMPVNGAILEDYSQELVYNEALADWRTHDGIDIGCNAGCSVSAAADGKIESVMYDVYGFSVTIGHDEGYKTVYTQLENVENIKEGDSVKAGDVIGTVGQSVGENVSEPHIHFEVYQDDECIDPKSLF